MFAEGFYLTKAEMDWFTEQLRRAGRRPRGPPAVAAARRGPGRPAAGASSSPRASTRCATRARPTPRRCATPASPVVLRRFTGLIHAFVNMTGVSPACHDALVETAGALRAVLATPAAAAAAPRRPRRRRGAAQRIERRLSSSAFAAFLRVTKFGPVGITSPWAGNSP